MNISDSLAFLFLMTLNRRFNIYFSNVFVIVDYQCINKKMSEKSMCKYKKMSEK